MPLILRIDYKLLKAVRSLLLTANILIKGPTKCWWRTFAEESRRAWLILNDHLVVGLVGFHIVHIRLQLSDSSSSRICGPSLCLKGPRDFRQYVSYRRAPALEVDHAIQLNHPTPVLFDRLGLQKYRVQTTRGGEGTISTCLLR